MSRIGKNPVAIPSGVTLDVKGQTVKAKGKLGELTLVVHPEVSVKMEGTNIIVAPMTNSRVAKANWATMQRLITNIVKGVNVGYTKKLEITGVGFRCAMQGSELVLQLGFSHEVRFKVPEGIKIAVEKQTQITITGIDKQKVGQVAAEIYNLKPPEPYKGKGIKYEGQKILRKEGKKK